MGARAYSIGDVFERGARLFPHETAVVCDVTRETFRELDIATNRIAHGLRQLGIRKGDRVAVLGRNCHRYLELYGGAAKAGAVLVPLNARLSPPELSRIIADADPAVVVASDDLMPLARETANAARGAREMLVLGHGQDGLVGLDEVITNADGGRPSEPVGADDLFLLMYTAAVEGRPRGAMVSHGNVVAANLQLVVGFGLTTTTVNLIMLPLFHVTGLALALAVLHAGGCSVALARFDSAAVLDTIERERATMFGEFAPMLSRLLDEQRRKPRDLGSLRCLTGLDRPEVIREAEALTGATFWAAYGQTETSIVSLAPFRDRPGAAGREGVLARVRVLDGGERECGPGDVGEIVVQGPTVFQGYWRLPEASADTHRGGWHHTGDLGYLDEAGYLWYVERKADKELIKPGGENVYPVEVERAITAHPDVSEVAVIGVPDREWGEAVKAICVLRQGARTTGLDIVEFVRTRIASYKKPKHVELVDALPKTADGRIDRGRVKALYGVPAPSRGSSG